MGRKWLGLFVCEGFCLFSCWTNLFRRSAIWGLPVEISYEQGSLYSHWQLFSNAVIEKSVAAKWEIDKLHLSAMAEHAVHESPHFEQGHTSQVLSCSNTVVAALEHPHPHPPISCICVHNTALTDDICQSCKATPLVFSKGRRSCFATAASCNGRALLSLFDYRCPWCRVMSVFTAVCWGRQFFMPERSERLIPLTPTPTPPPVKKMTDLSKHLTNLFGLWSVRFYSTIKA